MKTMSSNSPQALVGEDAGEQGLLAYVSFYRSLPDETGSADHPSVLSAGALAAKMFATFGHGGTSPKLDFKNAALEDWERVVRLVDIKKVKKEAGDTLFSEDEEEDEGEEEGKEEEDEGEEEGEEEKEGEEEGEDEELDEDEEDGPMVAPVKKELTTKEGGKLRAALMPNCPSIFTQNESARDVVAPPAGIIVLNSKAEVVGGEGGDFAVLFVDLRNRTELEQRELITQTAERCSIADFRHAWVVVLADPDGAGQQDIPPWFLEGWPKQLSLREPFHCAVATGWVLHPLELAWDYSHIGVQENKYSVKRQNAVMRRLNSHYVKGCLHSVKTDVDLYAVFIHACTFCWMELDLDSHPEEEWTTGVGHFLGSYESRLACVQAVLLLHRRLSMFVWAVEYPSEGAYDESAAYTVLHANPPLNTIEMLAEDQTHGAFFMHTPLLLFFL